MNTSRYPIWKSILWSLGPAAYLAGVTILSYILLWTVAPRVPLEGRSQQAVPILWVGLLALGAWQLFRRGRKMAGWIMTAATILAAMMSIVFYAIRL